MILKRREKVPFWTRLREVLSPRKGWRRGFDYIGKRMKRLPDTPHKIALGFACGAFISFTPLFTLHTPLAMLIAWMLGSNIIAGLLGTIVGNMVTTPFIAAGAISVGAWMLGTDVTTLPSLDDVSFGWLWDNFWTIFFPYLAGGVPLGIICGAVFYVIIRPLVAAYQARRRRRLAQRSTEVHLARQARSHQAAGPAPETAA